jgi:hypothetical protein
VSGELGTLGFGSVKRLKALKWMQAKAGDQPTAHHGQYFLKKAIRHYDVAKLLRKKTHVTQTAQQPAICPPTQRQQSGNSASGPVSQLKLTRADAKNKETSK